MRLFGRLFAPIIRYLAQHLWRFVRVIIGIFMIIIGIWFAAAPISQNFTAQQATLAESPFIWLIVPVGLVQIAIGVSLLIKRQKSSL